MKRAKRPQSRLPVGSKLAEIELEDRAHTRGQQLVDVAAACRRSRPHLLVDPAADGVERARGGPARAGPRRLRHAVVGRLADPGCPRLEARAPRAARPRARAIVELAEPGPSGGRRAGSRRPRRRDRGPGRGRALREELLEGDVRSARWSRQVLSWAWQSCQLPAAGRGQRLADRRRRRHRSPPTPSGAFEGSRPSLVIHASRSSLARAVEAATVASGRADRPPRRTLRTARHRAGTVSGRDGPRGRGRAGAASASHSPSRKRVVDQRGDPLDPPVGAAPARQRPADGQRRSGGASVHRLASGASAVGSTAARMSAQRECR